MTLQEIFTTVKTHLLTQRERSFESNSKVICAYRGFNGRKCAVGILIKDEFYHQGLERKPSHSKEVVTALELSGIQDTPEVRRLLERLQDVHDHHPPDMWVTKLMTVAEENGLQYQESNTPA